MAEFFNWLSSNSLAATTVIITFAAIAATAAIVFLVAFLQGREVSFWPPKIGPNPSLPQPKEKKRESQASASVASERSRQDKGEILIMQFANSKETLAYKLKRMREAQKSICDISWEQPFKTMITFGPDEVDEYLRIIEDKSRNIPYREIVMFYSSKGRVQKVRRLLDTAGKYYQLAGYADLPQDAPPLWQFVIIDDQEVILKDIAVRTPEVVERFGNYYDELWINATPIKTGMGEPDLTLLQKAERNLQNLLPQRTKYQVLTPGANQQESATIPFPQEQIQHLIEQHNRDFFQAVASRDLHYLDATTTPSGKEQSKENIQSWIDDIVDGETWPSKLVGCEIVNHRFISDQELEVTVDETWQDQVAKDQTLRSITRNVYRFVFTERGWLVNECQFLRPSPIDESSTDAES